jgi:hypothetical protein
MNSDSIQPFYLATAHDSEKTKAPQGLRKKGGQMPTYSTQGRILWYTHGTFEM